MSGPEAHGPDEGATGVARSQRHMAGAFDTPYLNLSRPSGERNTNERGCYTSVQVTVPQPSTKPASVSPFTTAATPSGVPL